MPGIKFRRLELVPGSLEVEAVVGADVYPLHFKWDRDFSVSEAGAANVLTVLCGRAYSEISFEFPVPGDVLEGAKAFTAADVRSEPGGRGGRIRRGGGVILSFSGGFDSLAAKALMPKRTALASLDFGGRFARERRFFSRFNPLIVETNIVSTPFRSNSYLFMAIAALIACEERSFDYHTFGSILEAGVENLRRGSRVIPAQTPIPLAQAGMASAPYVRGLSEAGTLKVLLQSNPELIGEGLVSLAGPGEEKLHRKKMLCRAVAERLGMSVELPEIVSPARPHFAFGEVFAVDLVAMYVAWVLGPAAVSGMVRDFPEDVLGEFSPKGLAFLEKWNPDMYKDFPVGLLPGLMASLAEYGMLPYTEDDWESVSILRRVLSKHFPEQ